MNSTTEKKQYLLDTVPKRKRSFKPTFFVTEENLIKDDKAVGAIPQNDQDDSSKTVVFV